MCACAGLSFVYSFASKHPDRTTGNIVGVSRWILCSSPAKGDKTGEKKTKPLKFTLFIMLAYGLLPFTKSEHKIRPKVRPQILSDSIVQFTKSQPDDGNTVTIGLQSYNDGAANTMQVMCECMTGMETTGFYAVMTLMEMGLIILNLEVLAHLLVRKGNIVAIGASDQGQDAREVMSLIVVKSFIIQGEAASDQSGYSVSLSDADDGNTVAIGAISNEWIRSSV
jgi:hypothetical protein